MIRTQSDNTGILLRRLASMFVFALVSASCGGLDAPGPIESELPEIEERLDEDVVSRLLVGDYVSGVQHAVLEVDFDRFPLSSYQVALSFDTGAFRLLEVVPPDADAHFVNAEASGSAALVAAGYALDGFEGPVRISLTFESDRVLRAGDFRIDLEVAGSVEGDPLDESRRVSIQSPLVEAVR